MSANPDDPASEFAIADFDGPRGSSLRGTAQPSGGTAHL
jgi:hypothetical protein